MKLNTYLNFDGNAEEAFNFYKSIFGGEFAGGIMKHPASKILQTKKKNG
jgi:PhnB protein